MKKLPWIINIVINGNYVCLRKLLHGKKVLFMGAEVFAEFNAQASFLKHGKAFG